MTYLHDPMCFIQLHDYIRRNPLTAIEHNLSAKPNYNEIIIDKVISSNGKNKNCIILIPTRSIHSWWIHKARKKKRFDHTHLLWSKCVT